MIHRLQSAQDEVYIVVASNKRVFISRKVLVY
jgi:hypothetical protein